MFDNDKNAYDHLLDRSVGKWLEDMREHEDMAVRGGIRATEDYIKYLKNKIEMLESKNRTKDDYLKKMSKRSF